MYRDTMEFIIDRAKCIRCGLCIHDCKNEAIEADPETGFPRVAPNGGEQRCMHCQHCLMICPAGALSIDGVDPAECPASGTHVPDYSSLLDLVRSRRSYRDYKQKNVDPSVIAELMDAMRFVPTGVNFHQLHFSLIDDIAVMNAYRDNVYARICKIFESPNVPEAAKNSERVYRQYRAGNDPVFRTAPHMLLVSTPKNTPCPDADPLIAVSYFELLAQAHGLGTVWFGRFLMMANSILPEMLEPFDLPENYVPGYAILFGEPSVRFPRIGKPEPVRLQRMRLDQL